MFAKYECKKKNEIIFVIFTENFFYSGKNHVSLHRETTKCSNIPKNINNIKQKEIIMETLDIKELHAGEEISLLYNICVMW